MSKEEIIQAIHDHFREIEWSYDYNERESYFHTGVTMNSSLGSLAIYVYVHETSYVVYACLSNHVEPCYCAQVAEYLHRANYGLLNGNFGMDFRDGEVRYKTFVSFEETTVPVKAIRASLVLPVLMFEKYGKNLLKLMLDVGDPQMLIREAETPEDEEQED